MLIESAVQHLRKRIVHFLIGARQCVQAVVQPVNGVEHFFDSSFLKTAKGSISLKLRLQITGNHHYFRENFICVVSLDANLTVIKFGSETTDCKGRAACMTNNEKILAFYPVYLTVKVDSYSLGCATGVVAEWLGSGLQIRLWRFDSARRLKREPCE